MKNRREKLASILCGFGVPSVSRRIFSDRITVLNYHRILGDDVALEDVPFDKNVYSCTASDFREHVKFAQSIGTVLSMKSFVELFESGESPPPNSSLFTFDDGYVDNFELAFPILRELGATASFFIPTAIIDSRELGWWDILSYIVSRSKRQVISLNYPVPAQFDLLEMGAKEVSRQLTRIVKGRDEIDYERFMQVVAEACDSNVPDKNVQSGELMTWENVRTMHEKNMTIGAHGDSHEILSHKSVSEQLTDLSTCRQKLASQLGSFPDVLAYPVGGRSHYTHETKRLVRELGFRCAFNFASDSRAVNIKSADRFDIDRIGIQWHRPNRFECLLSSIAI